MNWKVSIKYAATVFIVQCMLVFFEGLLFKPSVFVANSFRIASLLICGTIFLHLGTHQLYKPHVHAWIVLAIESAAGVALGLLLYPWIGVVEFNDVLLEYIILVSALIMGTSLGIKLRSKSKMSEMA